MRILSHNGETLQRMYAEAYTLSPIPLLDRFPEIPRFKYFNYHLSPHPFILSKV